MRKPIFGSVDLSNLQPIEDVDSQMDGFELPQGNMSFPDPTSYGSSSTSTPTHHLPQPSQHDINVGLEKGYPRKYWEKTSRRSDGQRIARQTKDRLSELKNIRNASSGENALAAFLFDTINDGIECCSFWIKSIPKGKFPKQTNFFLTQRANLRKLRSQFESVVTHKNMSEKMVISLISTAERILEKIKRVSMLLAKMMIGKIYSHKRATPLPVRSVPQVQPKLPPQGGPVLPVPQVQAKLPPLTPPLTPTVPGADYSGYLDFYRKQNDSGVAKMPITTAASEQDSSGGFLEDYFGEVGESLDDVLQAGEDAIDRVVQGETDAEKEARLASEAAKKAAEEKAIADAALTQAAKDGSESESEDSSNMGLYIGGAALLGGIAWYLHSRNS